MTVNPDELVSFTPVDSPAAPADRPSPPTVELPPPPAVDTVKPSLIDAPFGRNAIPSAETPEHEDPDPHGFASLVAYLDETVLVPRHGALLVAAAAMDSGEHAYGLLAGRFLGHPGVAVLTDRRLLAVNARPWSPNLAALPLAAGLTSETWSVSGMLVLRFNYGRTAIVIDGISDGEGSRQFAAAVRSLAR